MNKLFLVLKNFKNLPQLKKAIACKKKNIVQVLDKHHH